MSAQQHPGEQHPDEQQPHGAGINAVAERLAEERDRLEAEVGALEGSGLHSETESESLGDVPSHGQHPADLASETLEREVEFGLLDDLRYQLADVDAAIARMEAGSYGRCVDCGQPIGGVRLAALPAAARCISCQGALERGGSFGGPARRDH